MTNEEKAREIANHRESEFGEIRDINGCCYISALDMARWKDEQYQQKLEMILNAPNEVIRIELLTKLINNKL